MTEVQTIVKSQTYVAEDSTGKIRCVAKTFGSDIRRMEGIIAFRSGLMNYLPLFAQVAGTSNATTGAPVTGGCIDLSPRSALVSDETGITTQGLQNHILTRRALPTDIVGASATVAGVNFLEKAITATTDNAMGIYHPRFFFDEKLVENLIINGTIKFRTSVSVKSSNTSIAYLQRVIFRLRQINTSDNNYGTDITTCTVTLNVQNATTTYTDYSVVGFAAVTGQLIEASRRLVLEIATDGKATSGSTCTHKLSFEPGSSRTYVEIPIEEA